MIYAKIKITAQVSQSHGNETDSHKTVHSLSAASYEIKVRGSLDASWSNWFSGMMIISDEASPENRITTLKGPVVDQSDLHGILTRLWDMNYEIISLQQTLLLPDKEEQDE